MDAFALTVFFRCALGAALATLIFWTFVYSTLDRWWRDVIGRQLVVEIALTIGLLIPTAIGLYVHTAAPPPPVHGIAQPVFRHPGSTLTTAVMVLLIAPVMVWRTVVWIRTAGYTVVGYLCMLPQLVPALALDVRDDSVAAAKTIRHGVARLARRLVRR